MNLAYLDLVLVVHGQMFDYIKDDKTCAQDSLQDLCGEVRCVLKTDC